MSIKIKNYEEKETVKLVIRKAAEKRKWQNTAGFDIEAIAEPTQLQRQ
jgi:hypothetical protein